MFDTRRIRQDFSAAAPHYEGQTPLQKHVLTQLAGRMLPLLPKRARLLDAGCGTGRLARQYPGHTVTQLDIAHPMCRVAATPDAPAVNAMVQALPFRDAAFDGVFSSLMLQWAPDAGKALDEMRRVVMPGGVLAVSTFGPKTLHELRESFAAVDRYPHVSAFAEAPGFDKREVITEYYPDLFALMKHLKTIGASNKLLNARKSLMTRGQMQKVEDHYRGHFGAAQGLPVTWEILYCVARRS